MPPGAETGPTILWNPAAGSKILTLIGHSSTIQSVAFSPDGKFVATGSEDNTAKLWNVATGQEILTLPGSAGGVTGVGFSRSDNGAHLAVASGDGVVRIFLLQIGEVLSLAQARVTCLLTTGECKKYLHVEQCPAPVSYK